MSELKTGTKITLTQEDAKVYHAFRENREKFMILLQSGVFSLESGKVELNVHNNQIQNIHIHRMLYKRAADNGRIPI